MIQTRYVVKLLNDWLLSLLSTQIQRLFTTVNTKIKIKTNLTHFLVMAFPHTPHGIVYGCGCFRLGPGISCTAGAMIIPK